MIVVSRTIRGLGVRGEPRDGMVSPDSTVEQKGGGSGAGLTGSLNEIFRGDLGLILFDMTKDNENKRCVFGEQVALRPYSSSTATVG